MANLHFNCDDDVWETNTVIGSLEQIIEMHYHDHPKFDTITIYNLEWMGYNIALNYPHVNNIVMGEAFNVGIKCNASIWLHGGTPILDVNHSNRLINVHGIENCGWIIISY